MKLSDDQRTTWPPLLATSKPYRYETLGERYETLAKRGQRYTIRDAYLLDGNGRKPLHEVFSGEWYVHLDCEAPDGWPAAARLGPYPAKLAQSVVAALRKLRGQKLADAGKVEIDVR